MYKTQIAKLQNKQTKAKFQKNVEKSLEMVQI